MTLVTLLVTRCTDLVSAERFSATACVPSSPPYPRYYTIYGDATACAPRCIDSSATLSVPRVPKTFPPARWLAAVARSIMTTHLGRDDLAELKELPPTRPPLRAARASSGTAALVSIAPAKYATHAIRTHCDDDGTENVASAVCQP